MIADIERRAVLHAVAEAARSGPDQFLRRHGFRPGTRDVLEVGGLLLPPKAVVAVASAYQHGGRPLRACEFSGGLEHASRVLVRLGFTVRRDQDVLTHEDVAIPQRLSLRPLSGDLRLYVCHPTNRRSVAACYEHDFGTLLSPLTVLGGHKLSDLSGRVSPLPGRPYVIDNGAWSCHVAGVEWDERPLRQLLERLSDGPAPEWGVLPDIIGAGEESLARSISWHGEHPELERIPWLLAVQDGMTVESVRGAVLDRGLAGIFVGGSTPWKWATAHQWAELGMELGVRVHVGRVNTLRRAELCRDLGVSSIDGSCVTRFAIKAPLLARACDGDDRPPQRDDPRSRHSIAKRRFELTLGAPA